MEAFKGFTPKTIQFFHDLAANNNKEWFEENRPVYEKELITPFKELVNTLSPSMHNIDSHFELRPHRVLSRIYRDVRFSKNKDPYKTCLWMNFQQRVNEWQGYPGFFMELNGENYFYGMGLYQSKRKDMDDFRERLEIQGEEFQRVTQKTVLDRDFKIMGDEYKRPLASNLDEYFQQWVQRKTIYVIKSAPISDVVFSPQFAEQIREDFQALEWLYNFFKNEY